MPKKKISRKVQRTLLLSQVSFESFFSVSDNLDQLTTSVFQLAGTLDQVWGLGLVQWQKLLQVSAIAMVMMVICVNLRMTDPRRIFFDTGDAGNDAWIWSASTQKRSTATSLKWSTGVGGSWFTRLGLDSETLLFGWEEFALIWKQPDNVSSVYTSGRKCNFQKKGCEAPQVKYELLMRIVIMIRMCLIGMGKLILVPFWVSSSLWTSTAGFGRTGTWRFLQQTFQAGDLCISDVFSNASNLERYFLNAFISEDGFLFLSGKHSGVEPENLAEPSRIITMERKLAGK